MRSSVIEPPDVVFTCVMGVEVELTVLLGLPTVWPANKQKYMSKYSMENTHIS